MVGSNEFEEAWLDEGFTTYSTAKRWWRPAAPTRPSWSFSDPDGRPRHEPGEQQPTARYNRVLAKSWDYTPSGAYGFYSYYKPSLALGTLEGYLGEQTMARVMRTYHERGASNTAQRDFFAW